MKIKNFDHSTLQAETQKLYALCTQKAAPDIIIGIRSGGYVVAELMIQSTEKKPILLAISRQRTGTARKKSLKPLLRRLPYAISNPLRIIEHYARRIRPRHRQDFITDEAELNALKTALAAHPAAYILVVDDAVDSGETLNAVLGILHNYASAQHTIRSAAITVTTPTPLTEPDFTLYRHTLCRFHWSFDFRG